MRLLIDTHAILWFQSSDTNLSNQAKSLIINEENTCFISIISLWEIAIKISLNKLTIGMNLDEFHEYLLMNNFEILNLKFSHIQSLHSLPGHHKDPFDRLLIAQAVSEGLTIISADQHFAAYSVNVTW